MDFVTQVLQEFIEDHWLPIAFGSLAAVVGETISLARRLREIHTARELLARDSSN